VAGGVRGPLSRWSGDVELDHLALQPCGTHLQLDEDAPKRPALLDPPHPQVVLHIGEPQVGQPGLPLGRPAGGLPLDRPVGPAGRPAAWQSLLVEPVPHHGRAHPKLAGDAGAGPSSCRRSVGKVCPQRREAQLRRLGGQLLVGGGAPRMGGGHPAGRGDDAYRLQRAADHRDGGAKLAGQLRGTGLLLCACQQVAVKVAVPLRVRVAVEVLLLAVEDREAASEGQRARRWCWWWRYTCAWRAGRPTTPGDPLSSELLGTDRTVSGSPDAWVTPNRTLGLLRDPWRATIAVGCDKALLYRVHVLPS